jgi:pimeloyl-ACP methyl ester carboxylesterase
MNTTAKQTKKICCPAWLWAARANQQTSGLLQKELAMSTLSEQRTTTPYAAPAQTGERGIWRRAGAVLLKILAGLLAALTLLPVLLLPIATAVPVWLWLLLLLLDAGLLVGLWRVDGWALKTAVLAALIAVAALAVLLSQQLAATPAITGADGRALPGSIAALEQVDLNGREQWISIRGADSSKPVLLFLAGGPGGSQLAATRMRLGELEKQFVVVNWEQPGAGKSYGAVNMDRLTPELYIEDGLALTQYLRERFGQEKITILGESWGSILGVWLVQRQPEWYHAFAGVAQMVAFLETDTYDYNLALQIARERGDTGKIAALEQQGPPPYYGDGVTWKVTEYIMYLSSYMAQDPAITGPGYNTFGEIAAAEYGLVDKVNYVRGLTETMNVMWPQLWEMDLREQAPRLEVPVYFLEGRHDVNAPPALVEEYLGTLDAPHKEIIWFEHSGHSPWVDETDKLVDVLVNTVLPGPQP